MLLQIEKFLESCQCRNLKNKYIQSHPLIHCIILFSSWLKSLLNYLICVLVISLFIPRIYVFPEKQLWLSFCQVDSGHSGCLRGMIGKNDKSVSIKKGGGNIYCVILNFYHWDKIIFLWYSPIFKIIKYGERLTILQNKRNTQPKLHIHQRHAALLFFR